MIQPSDWKDYGMWFGRGTHTYVCSTASHNDGRAFTHYGYDYVCDLYEGGLLIKLSFDDVGNLPNGHPDFDFNDVVLEIAMVGLQIREGKVSSSGSYIYIEPGST
ncbi:hypothetical protein A1D31_25610 [Bradyrhizobium liaoningense]|nr:hypothetical protein A1D31_25610 [Bradyrhizobium liaoningense]